MTNDASSSVLLPAAAVDIFALSEETIQAAGRLVDDWRFARVTISVEKSGMDEAIAKYAAHVSPALVIIETSDISQDFIAKLETLASNCSADTAAVVIGPTNDVSLYRHLVHMGVSDYLVRPVSSEDLSEVISETLIGRMGISDSRLVAVLGAKGGVGASAISQVFARVLADNIHVKTAFMDACGGWSSHGIGFNFDSTTTLREAAATAQAGTEESLMRLLTRSGEQLSILASGGEPMLESCVDADGYEALINRLMKKYPVVVVDLSHAEAGVTHRILSKAHGIALVSTPTLPSLRNARALLKEIKQLRGSLNPVRLIINMRGLAPGTEVNKNQISEALDFVVSAEVPFDPKLFLRSEADSQTVIEHKNGAVVVNALGPLICELAGHKSDVEAGAEQPASILSKVLAKTGKKEK